ncbi:MAG: hypothetical protein AB7V55_08505 [Oscillospiraceae bacterium]
MRRFFAWITATALLGGLLAGCARAEQQARPGIEAAAPSLAAEAAPETAQTALRALLPTGQDALEQLLQQMAAEEGLELEIETAAAGTAMPMR